MNLVPSKYCKLLLQNFLHSILGFKNIAHSGSISDSYHTWLSASTVSVQNVTVLATSSFSVCDTWEFPFYFFFLFSYLLFSLRWFVQYCQMFMATIRGTYWIEHDVDRPRIAYGSKTKPFLSPIQTGSDEEVFYQGLILALSIKR